MGTLYTLIYRYKKYFFRMPRKGYKSISIPEDLVKEIERIINKHRRLGYRTVAEFITDAIRRRIEELEKEETI